jgi:glycine cleavage system H lipoate-binding protein
MDGFHYYNLFETKGMEYILTIIFFLTLVPFWLILNRMPKKTKALTGVSRTLTAAGINMPRGVYHSPNYSWMYLLKSGKARVGLSELLLKITGQITVKPLKSEGEKIVKGEPLLEVSQGKKKIIINSPLSGILLTFGQKANHEELLIDPYGSGWVAEIEPIAWISETSRYFLAEDTNNWAKFEIVRFRDFLIKSLATSEPQLHQMALQDGGELKEHIMQELSEEIWTDFETNFLPKHENGRI